MSKTTALFPKIKNEVDFYKSIRAVIAEKRHVNYLQDVIQQYEDYKQMFAGVFIPPNDHYNSVFRFRVDYLLKHPVWRVFEILGCQSFNELAMSIIDYMDWANDHMHAFYLPEKTGKSISYEYTKYGIYAPQWEDDPFPTYKTDNVLIAHLDYQKYPKLGFVFDFGDGHRFNVSFQNIRASKKQDSRETLPRLIDQRGVGPEQYPDFEEE
ncbi:MAG: hypothetical protein HY973_01415 [Candidatus Kerfeldbacteria bacterium]|nr:hypothetical protein [Candidatus Kerfeldbacteria bacterium]